MPSPSTNDILTKQAERTALPVDALRHESAKFSERAKWSREQITAFQRDRLKSILDHAVRHSPYYAETMGTLVARNAPLDELPLLTKRMMMADFERIVTDRRLNRDVIERHLDGPEAGTLLLGVYRAAATGGTSGERGVIVYDDEAWLEVMAVIGRAQRLIGITADMRSVGIAAASPIHLSNRFYIEARVARPGSPRLDMTMPLSDIVKALNDYQPHAIATYPSFVRVLAQEQREGRLHIAPVIIRTGAETLLPEVRALARATWGSNIYNSYSSTEAGQMACECTEHSGLHIAEDHLIMEVVDEDGRSVPDGVQGSRCLITTLGNRAVPLIRYELSDILAVTQEPCPCGGSFARITSIEGRREERITFLREGGGTVEFGAIVLRSPLIAIAGLQQFQIQHGVDTLNVKLVIHSGADPRAVERNVVESLTTALQSRGAISPVIGIEFVDVIERVGAASKERQTVKLQ